MWTIVFILKNVLTKILKHNLFFQQPPKKKCPGSSAGSGQQIVSTQISTRGQPDCWGNQSLLALFRGRKTRPSELGGTFLASLWLLWEARSRQGNNPGTSSWTGLNRTNLCHQWLLGQSAGGQTVLRPGSRTSWRHACGQRARKSLQSEKTSQPWRAACWQSPRGSFQKLLLRGSLSRRCHAVMLGP